MVMKMPAKSFATSTMGLQVKSLPVRKACGVNINDNAASQSSATLRAMSG